MIRILRITLFENACTYYEDKVHLKVLLTTECYFKA